MQKRLKKAQSPDFKSGTNKCQVQCISNYLCLLYILKIESADVYKNQKTWLYFCCLPQYKSVKGQTCASYIAT